MNTRNTGGVDSALRSFRKGQNSNGGGSGSSKGLGENKIFNGGGVGTATLTHWMKPITGKRKTESMFKHEFCFAGETLLDEVAGAYPSAAKKISELLTQVAYLMPSMPVQNEPERGAGDHCGHRMISLSYVKVRLS
ncbi:hypothetical protein EVAR_79179_1 [Eumeta japonica]|uniref:Uncharacterized protein n=1 Tax=Eumeta variegata TaxID=151549 RepID=A0A4C1UTT2_EUMVA|nr:hypothetical protein EVAR_79179_1 [Eumeta japonica]